MPGRKEYRGGAGIITLNTAINAASTNCQADGTVTGWPTGVSYPFVIRIDPGLANEEKILCTSLTAGTPNTIAFTQRGYDGTSAAAHGVGAQIQHCEDADSFDTFADHVFNTARDDHTQYLRTDGSRPPTNVAGMTGTPVGVGTAIAPGSSNLLVRADHVHKLNDGAINLSSMFAAGVVDSAAIKNLAVVNGDIADATITAGKLVNNTLTALQIAPGAITSNELLDGTIALADFSETGYRVVHTCTSSTRPASPSPGDMIWETDTHKFLIYQTTTTGWTPPWNMAWGEYGSATKTTDQLGITGITAVTSLSVTGITVVGNRATDIELIMPLLMKGTVLDGDIKVWIYVDAGAFRQTIFNQSIPAGKRASVSGRMRINLAAGSHDFTVQALSTAGSVDINCTTLANGDPGPAVLTVSDGGPAANPI
jgi:hypothetical protein